MKFVVYGRPQPQGSTRSFLRGGKIATTSDNRQLKPWRQQVSDTAFVELGCMPYAGDGQKAVVIHCHFFFARPKSAKKRVFPTVKPDLDKCVRAILDALTGIAYRDDSQVVVVVASKNYSARERVEIEIEELSDPREAA
jgi:Holliday junction resolvase RusA-like endonuclease